MALLIGVIVLMLPPVRQALGSACIPPGDFCDNVQEEIDDLQNHPNPDCQVLGDQAQMRFDDEHSWFNNFSELEDMQFIAQPNADQHAGAPTNTGISQMPNNPSTMQGNIAYNEAEAAGSNGQYFSELCD